MTATLVELIDGQFVASDAEAWRHECEARWLLDLRPLEKRREMLAFIETKRVPEAAQALRDTIQALHAKARAGA